MENNNSKHSSLGLIICMVLIVILLAIILVMYLHYNYSSTSLDLLNNISGKTQTNINEKTNIEQKDNTSKLDEEKVLVYDSYTNITSEYSYSLPHINIDSVDANTINSEIESYYKPLISNIDENVDVELKSIKYDSFINDNILSLVISSETTYEVTSYKVYNIDINTGSIIKDSDLLKVKDISMSELLTALKAAYKDKYISLFGSEETLKNKEQQLTFYKDQLNKTINIDANSYSSTSLFFNNENKLSAIATIYPIAGASEYYYIVNTNI